MSRNNSKSDAAGDKDLRNYKGRFAWIHDPLKNFRAAALVATIIAVILLGFTIGLGAKVCDQNSQIKSLKNEVTMLQDSAYDQMLKVAQATQNYQVVYDGVNGQTALSLLQKSHSVETKDYGAMGQMVVAIDGVKPDTKHFWAFYVNDAMATEGASTYKTKNSDVIWWKLEAIQ